MQRVGGNKWDERGQDMKELLVLWRERARAWDREKGPLLRAGPVRPGCSGLCSGTEHKQRPQTSVSPGPAADHPHRESLVLISSSPSPLGLVLPLCTPRVPCSSPLLPPHYRPFLPSTSHQPGCKEAVGDHAKSHTKGHGKTESILCSLQTTSLAPGGWGAAGKQVVRFECKCIGLECKNQEGQREKKKDSVSKAMRARGEEGDRQSRG